MHLCSQGQEKAALPQAHLSAEEVRDSETMRNLLRITPTLTIGGSSHETGSGTASRQSGFERTQTGPHSEERVGD